MDWAATGQQSVWVRAGGVGLSGILSVPDGAVGVVVFAHGAGSSRHSPRNRQVADRLNDSLLATLLVDLLTVEEDNLEQRGAMRRFDVPLLAGRLAAIVDWLVRQPSTRALPVGIFGSSTGAAAALTVAAAEPRRVGAVVSRGGRPDLAHAALPKVKAPTLLIVGGDDEQVVVLNQRARAMMRCQREIVVIPGATHLFEEPGALERVSDLATSWFLRHLAGITEAVPATAHDEHIG